MEKVSFTEGEWKLGRGKCLGSRENRSEVLADAIST